MSKLPRYMFVLLLLVVSCATPEQQRPPSPSAPSARKKNTLIASVPFQNANGFIIVMVNVNGSPRILRFVVDTGAAKSVLDTKVAEQINLPSRAPSRARIFGIPFGPDPRVVGHGTNRLPYRVADDVQISLLDGTRKAPLATAQDLGFVVMSLSAAQANDVQFDGILGHDFFQCFVVQIDWQTKMLRLFERSSYTYPGKEPPLAFTFHGGIPTLKVPITPWKSKAFSAELLVDTGSNAVFEFNSATVVRRNLLTGTRTVPSYSAGVGGRESSKIGRLGAADLGSHRITAPVAAFSMTESGSGASGDHDGAIGTRILNRFTVTLDYGNSQLYLKPNRIFGRPFVWYYIGMEVKSHEEGVRIVSVLPESSAQRSGLQADDIITAIDGIPARRATFAKTVCDSRRHRFIYWRERKKYACLFRADSP